MSLKSRRFLYIIFVLLFLVITPVVCLYAAGYKLGTNFSVQKTGMLTIETEPKGASIYLNGKQQRNFLKRLLTKESGHITTPAKIKNLLPGEYNIKLEKEGYWEWQKKLTISPGQSTFIENIIFFRKTLPIMLAENIPENISPSQEEKNIAFFNEAEIKIYNIKREDAINIKVAPTSPVRIINEQNFALSWSPQNKKILLNNIIYNIDEKVDPVILNDLIGGKISNIKWDDKDEDVIYYSSKNSINYYDIASNISKNIVSEEEIQDYFKKDNYIFYINKKNDSTYLSAWDIEGEKIAGEIIIENSSYRFINTDHELINLLDTAGNKLLLIDPFSKIKNHYSTIENAKMAVWADNDTLAFANDFELWIHDFKNSKSTLLTRISSPIKKIVWHPSDNYIIFSTGDTINTIELDERDNYNSIELIKIDEVKSPILNQEGNELYFYGKIGKQQGFYKLSI